MLWCSTFTPGLNWLSLKDWSQQLTQPAWLHFFGAEVSYSVRWGPNKWPLTKWSYSLLQDGGLEKCLAWFAPQSCLPVWTSELSSGESATAPTVTATTPVTRTTGKKKQQQEQQQQRHSSEWCSENSMFWKCDYAKCRSRWLPAMQTIETKKGPCSPCNWSLKIEMMIKINWVLNWAQSHL